MGGLWGHLGIPWGHPGLCRGRFGATLGGLWGYLGAPWGVVIKVWCLITTAHTSLKCKHRSRLAPVQRKRPLRKLRWHQALISHTFGKYQNRSRLTPVRQKRPQDITQVQKDRSPSAAPNGETNIKTICFFCRSSASPRVHQGMAGISQHNSNVFSG